LNYYSEMKLVHSVDGSRDIESVWADVAKILKTLK